MKLIALLTCLLSSLSYGATLECKSGDLEVSVKRSQQQSLRNTSNRYAEASTLKLQCNEKAFFFHVNTPSIPKTINSLPSGLAVSLDAFLRAEKKQLEAEEDRHQRDTMKSYLATILMAKSSNLSVKISYDESSGFNYYSNNDGKQLAILGITVK